MKEETPIGRFYNWMQSNDFQREFLKRHVGWPKKRDKRRNTGSTRGAHGEHTDFNWERSQETGGINHERLEKRDKRRGFYIRKRRERRLNWKIT